MNIKIKISGSWLRIIFIFYQLRKILSIPNIIAFRKFIKHFIVYYFFFPIIGECNNNKPQGKLVQYVHIYVKIILNIITQNIFLI